MARKLLIIDDDPAFRELVRISLMQENQDLQVEEARDGHVGERKLRETHFDLILLDYRLPFGMDGLRFLERTIDLRTGTSLIMITGEGNEEVAAHAFRLGATDYLVKGNNLLWRLQRVVAEILARQEGGSEPRRCAAINTAASGVEFINRYQDQMPVKDSEDDSKMEEAVMVEFDDAEEFNRFSSFVKRLDGVRIQDVRILEGKYVFLLSLLPTRFQRMGKVFVTR
jgi:DNA-binding response OmpR family regulator